MTDQTTEDTAAYCTCSAMRAIVDHHLKPMSAENAELKHRNADLFRRLGEHMDDLGDARTENTKLAAALAEARELARRWQRDAHKHREIADSRPGLTQIERAEIRQAATEIEQCSRQLVAEIGPDPAERVETTTHADPEPHGLAAIRDRVKSDPILTEAEIDGASSGWIELMQARRDRAELLAALDTELDEQTHPATFRETGENLNVRADVQGNLSAAPLTLAQAAGHLHDWAGDLADGARTDWPAGHPDIIRGIRAAADWLDARATYETETREQMRALVDRHGMADRTCLIGDDTRTPDAAVDAVVTILDRVVSGHLDDRDREGEDWSGPHPISIESDARRIIAAVQPHLIATAREAEEAPEPAEPTWRDVIRAMRAENIRLRPLYDIANWPADRTWQLIDRHGNELGIVTHETSYAGEDWALALSYERGPSTRIGAEALEPTDVLAAARLAGLIGDKS